MSNISHNKTLKKIELHTHLEGTITPTLARELAKKNNLAFPEHVVSKDGHAYLYQDFLDFLKTYDVIAAMICHPEDYYTITFDYLKNSAKNNVIYTEMMYSPEHAEAISKIPSHEHLLAIQKAIDDAKDKFGIIGRILITAVRHLGAESAINVAKHAIAEDLPCVVGFGLGGDEINFPPQLFKTAYEIASSGGLACTVHAGEFAGADSMLTAIECLPIKRIGHGVRGIANENLLSQLKHKNISLEICPSSNIALKLFKDMASHPLPKFIEAGISVSLGSDDPPFFNTTIADEYARVQNAYNYSDEEMNQISKMAIDAAFADDKTKAVLRHALEN